LSELARFGAASVTLSVTSLRRDLQRELEPRTSTPQRRLEAIRILADAGIPVRVNVAPIIPGLTDEEIPSILEAAAEAGATSAGRIMLRLPGAVTPIFDAWLRRVVPDRRDKVMNRLAEMRGGRSNDPRFRTRMRGQGIWADQVHQVFEVAARRFGLDAPHPTLSTGHFRVPGSVEQVELF
jgi:DNA repair photolyase